MSGYTRWSNAVMFDVRLSWSARGFYGALAHLTWLQTGSNEPPVEPVELPPLPQIASRVGLSVSAIRGYIAELRDVGLLVTVRASQRRPTMYRLVDPGAVASEVESTPLSEVDSTSLTRVRAISEDLKAKTKPQSESSSPPDSNSPPPVDLIDGRNLPLDALLSECSIDPASPRVAQAVAALNGSRTRGMPKGIRHLYWIEAFRWAEANDALDELEKVQEDPERFARGLQRAIHQKAARYRAVHPTWDLTPTALRSHWLDLERGTGGDENVSGDEARRIAERVLADMES